MKQTMRGVRRRMEVRRLLYGAASLALVFITGLVTNWLSGSADLWALPVLVTVWLVAGGVAFLLSVRSSNEIVVRLDTPLPVRTPAEVAQRARRGLIVFVSLYKPGEKAEAAKALSQAERLAAAEAGDYQALDVMRSNLATTIHAALNHAPALEHCWLIATTAQDPSLAVSLPYVKPVVAYLKEVGGLRCKFYCGAEYSVSIDDVAAICPKTYDLVRRVYAQADRLKLPHTHVVADFTPCPRDMTLGVILASLSSERDVQFMETRYSATGAYQGPLTPVIFHFEPHVDEGS